MPQWAAATSYPPKPNPNQVALQHPLPPDHHGPSVHLPYHFLHFSQPPMLGQHMCLAQWHHPHQQSSLQQHCGDNSAPAGGRLPTPAALPVLPRLRLNSSARRRAGPLPPPQPPIAAALLSFPTPAPTIPLTTTTHAVPVPLPASIPVAAPDPQAYKAQMLPIRGQGPVDPLASWECGWVAGPASTPSRSVSHHLRFGCR